MKQNKNNRFAALLLALCMAVCCALPALAAPAASANIDLSRTGSMDVTLYDHQNDVPLRGGALTVYKVADVARTNGDLHFVYTADFTGCAGRPDGQHAGFQAGSQAARPRRRHHP